MKLVKEIRSKDGVLHFQRYAILDTKYLSIYIHKIYEADKDPYLHNHPWNFFNLILKNSYIEVLDTNKYGRIRYPGCFGFYNAIKHFHKISCVLPGKPVTTLVITGKRYNNWGYKVGDRIVSNEEYREIKNGFKPVISEEPIRGLNNTIYDDHL